MSELGDLLRSTRQKRNLSLAEVARATRIKQTYLSALEEGDYGLLPGSAYITGFLRNYASYLGLHPDDVVQEYHALAPRREPRVKAATRVLANGHQRVVRRRLIWLLSAVALLLVAAYAVKQYNDSNAHAYSAPLLTPSNLGAVGNGGVHRAAAPRPIHLRLRAVAPVWVGVTVDGRRVFAGILRDRMGPMRWTAQQSIYVLTYDGAHLRAFYDGRRLGRLATHPGLLVDLATPTRWQRVY
jgi:transcriptional regulator with XRE-family HTH domain